LPKKPKQNIGRTAAKARITERAVETVFSLRENQGLFFRRAEVEAVLRQEQQRMETAAE